MKFTEDIDAEFHGKLLRFAQNDDTILSKAVSPIDGRPPTATQVMDRIEQLLAEKASKMPDRMTPVLKPF